MRRAHLKESSLGVILLVEDLTEPLVPVARQLPREIRRDLANQRCRVLRGLKGTRPAHEHPAELGAVIRHARPDRRNEAQPPVGAVRVLYIRHALA